MSQKKISIIVAGAGNREKAHAGYVLNHPEEAEIVGVAEPREFHRLQMAKAHAIPEKNVFTDWREMAARDKFADAVLITTSDSMHVVSPRRNLQLRATRSCSRNRWLQRRKDAEASLSPSSRTM